MGDARIVVGRGMDDDDIERSDVGGNGDEASDSGAPTAAERAPALAARADRMIWPRGDLADRAAASLVAVTTAENPGDQQAPLLQFLELDNEFRDKHCNEPLRS